jgi:predicted phosphodiesterase
MKILAFSDVIKWEGYEEIVDEIKPSIICLAGDLTSDGFAEFWRSPFTSIKSHVDGFYKFLRYAGRKARVLIVKGDHDDDVAGAYDVEKINAIEGCEEISQWKIVNIYGLNFLGLGANETHNLRTPSAPRLKDFRKKVKVDIVVMHGENIHLVSLLKPKIIIKGGWFCGACLVEEIPSVFTGPNSCTIIEFRDKVVSKISLYTFRRENKQIKLEKIPKRIPIFYEKFSWIKSCKL